MDRDKKFILDRKISFKENIKKLRKWNKDKKNEFGFAPRKGSDNYICLKTLFNGAKIDDYTKAPYNAKGEVMRNVASRVSDLYNGFNVQINRKRVEGTSVVEYWIE